MPAVVMTATPQLCCKEVLEHAQSTASGQHDTCHHSCQVVPLVPSQRLTPALPAAAGSLDALAMLSTEPSEDFDLVREIDCILPTEVQEQRVSNLLQSLLVAVCLRESLVLHAVPFQKLPSVPFHKLPSVPFPTPSFCAHS